MATDNLANQLIGIGGDKFANRVISVMQTDENKERLLKYLSVKKRTKESVLAYVEYEKESVEKPR